MSQFRESCNFITTFGVVRTENSYAMLFNFYCFERGGSEYTSPTMSRFSIPAMLFFSTLFAATTFAQKTDAPNTKQPVATVDGQPIYDEDLAPSVEGQLQPIRNQEYEIKRKALDNLIEQKMLEAAAKKKGLTTEKLLDQEVNAKVSDPSDAELQGYYVGLGKVTQPFADVKTKLRDSYKQTKIRQAREDYL